MHEGRILMSQKERDRKVILSGVVEGKLTLVGASKKLKVSYRQIKRIYKRYQRAGDLGLVHGNCGKASHRAYREDFKQAVLKLYREKYEGFGPTLACEKLGDEGYRLSDETLRLWLMSEGLWDKKRQRKGYRKRRERRACFGDLLQLDGSHHRWFGEENPAYCLMNVVDDATGITLSLMSEEETTEAAMVLLKRWVERYGVPNELYVDLKNVYVLPNTPQAEKDSEFSGGLTHFGRACEKLGITIIKAYSPQAKGRVERNHAVYQDRFVKELKLRQIRTVEQANALLVNGFIEGLNRKFAKTPSSEMNAHRAIKNVGNLDHIFCWNYQRIVQPDWTVSFFNQHYQIAKMKPLIIRPKQSVTVRKHLDGSVTLWSQNQRLPASKITQRTIIEKIRPEAKQHASSSLSQRARKNRSKTPWSLFNPDWLSRQSKQKGTF